ncbi:hypothetical protein TIFTF001_035751 [Ficus carica]|uniref:Uncharacterized protein n=1 Tax=Ficus carica TaxID=3494 RepID=A0AA88JAE7_FICCA|nr:hypothetical protein TIFTF001_035751 [Ficus carica]
MRVRHLKLLASMSHPPSLHTKHQGSATTRSHNKEATHHGLALVSNSSSLLSWLAQALPKPHHDRPLEEATPLGLALMNPHSRLPSLAPLASQGLHTSP